MKNYLIRNLLNLSGFTYNKRNKNTNNINNILDKQSNNKSKLLFIILLLYLFSMAFYLKRKYLMDKYLTDKLKYEAINKEVARISSLY